MSRKYMKLFRLFEGAKHAKLYAKYRPSYPKVLHQTIESYYLKHAANPLNLAIDVGCGNGQSTLPLTRMCKQVIGIDMSGEQISEAKRMANKIDFREGFAEDMRFQGNGTVDLVTVGTAIHWLDVPLFWREATRVLRPGGVLAVYSFTTDIVHNEQAHHLIWEDFFHNTLKDYWTDRRIHLDNGLASIELPFANSIRSDPFLVEREVDIDSYIGFLRTWSSWQLFEKTQPHSTVLTDLRQRLQILYTNKTAKEVNPMKVTSTIHLLMGQKPLNQTDSDEY